MKIDLDPAHTLDHLLELFQASYRPDEKLTAQERDHLFPKRIDGIHDTNQLYHIKLEHEFQHWLELVDAFDDDNFAEKRMRFFLHPVGSKSSPGHFYPDPFFVMVSLSEYRNYFLSLRLPLKEDMHLVDKSGSFSVSGDLDDLDRDLKERFGMGNSPTAWKAIRRKADQPDTPSPEHTETEHEDGGYAAAVKKLEAEVSGPPEEEEEEEKEDEEKEDDINTGDINNNDKSGDGDLLNGGNGLKTSDDSDGK